jgi:ribosomal protein S18 acetylase RimI-like enzyme
MQTYHLKEINQSDESNLICFFRKNNIPEITDLFNPFPLNEEIAKKLCRKKSKDKYYVVNFEDKIIGFSMLRGLDEGYDTPSFGILIDKSYQGRGIGRDITLQVIEKARKFCKKIRLSIYEDNFIGKGLYESLGWKEIEKKKSDKRPKINELIMMLELK